MTFFIPDQLWLRKPNAKNSLCRKTSSALHKYRLVFVAVQLFGINSQPEA